MRPSTEEPHLPLQEVGPDMLKSIHLFSVVGKPLIFSHLGLFKSLRISGSCWNMEGRTSTNRISPVTINSTQPFFLVERRGIRAPKSLASASAATAGYVIAALPPPNGDHGRSRTCFGALEAP